jgi:hypothetical protein
MIISIKDKNVFLDDDVSHLDSFTFSLITSSLHNTYYVGLSVLLHRYLVNIPYKSNMIVDHINGNPLDNRKSNLRITTQSVNSQNRHKQKTNKSGYPGIIIHKLKSGKYSYRAYIQSNSNFLWLGSYETLKEALKVRSDAVNKMHDKPLKPIFNKPFKIINIKGREVLIDEEDENRLRFFRFHIRGDRVILSIPLHRYIMGLKYDDHRVIDHIDGNGLNNKKSNLRIVSIIENSRNIHIKKTNKTGCHGVRELCRKNKNGSFTIRYQARICVNHKDTYLGTFTTPEDAHKAYLKGVQKYFGEIAIEGRRSIDNDKSK